MCRVVLVPSNHAQPGLPHFVAVSMAVIKWCLERTGCVLPSHPWLREGEPRQLRGGAPPLRFRPTRGEGGPGKRVVQLQLCPQARQDWVPEPSHFPSPGEGVGWTFENAFN